MVATFRGDIASFKLARRIGVRLVAATVAAAAACSALACPALPASVARDPKALVAEARGVVLVTAIMAPNGKTCELRPLRFLKGTPGQPLNVACRLPRERDVMTDFSGHNEVEFWNGGGRLGVREDCSLMTPAFKPGKMYVFLLGVKPDIKQYEQITGAADSWVKFIEKQPSLKAR